MISSLKLCAPSDCSIVSSSPALLFAAMMSVSRASFALPVPLWLLAPATPLSFCTSFEICRIFVEASGGVIRGIRFWLPCQILQRLTRRFLCTLIQILTLHSVHEIFVLCPRHVLPSPRTLLLFWPQRAQYCVLTIRGVCLWTPRRSLLPSSELKKEVDHTCFFLPMISDVFQYLDLPL